MKSVMKERVWNYVFKSKCSERRSPGCCDWKSQMHERWRDWEIGSHAAIAPGSCAARIGFDRPLRSSAGDFRGAGRCAPGGCRDSLRPGRSYLPRIGATREPSGAAPPRVRRPPGVARRDAAPEVHRCLHGAPGNPQVRRRLRADRSRVSGGPSRVHSRKLRRERVGDDGGFGGASRRLRRRHRTNGRR